MPAAVGERHRVHLLVPALKSIIQLKNQPNRTVMTSAASRMPRYLPSKNWRRETGLLIRVTAVRPSISSLIDVLARTAPKHNGREHDDVLPQLLDHQVVFAEGEVGDERDDDHEGEGEQDDQPEHRLAEPFAESRQGDRPALGPDGRGAPANTATKQVGHQLELQHR